MPESEVPLPFPDEPLRTTPMDEPTEAKEEPVKAKKPTKKPPAKAKKASRKPTPAAKSAPGTPGKLKAVKPAPVKVHPKAKAAAKAAKRGKLDAPPKAKKQDGRGKKQTGKVRGNYKKFDRKGTGSGDPKKGVFSDTPAGYLQELVLKGGMTDAQIWAKLTARYPLPDSRRGYISWMRNYLRERKGMKLPPRVAPKVR